MVYYDIFYIFLFKKLIEKEFFLWYYKCTCKNQRGDGIQMEKKKGNKKKLATRILAAILVAGMILSVAATLIFALIANNA